MELPKPFRRNRRPPDPDQLDRDGPGPHRDSPVGAEDDQLGREPFARLLARQVELVRKGSGLVIALVGPWGAGKTSVLRMAIAELRSAERENGRGPSTTVVAEFNPWLFSGSQQLMQLLFATLGDELERELGKASAKRFSQALRRYGGTVGRLGKLPGVGGLFGTAEDLLKGAADSVNELPTSLHEAKADLTAHLADADFRLVVFVDDVDRLAASEVRDLMRVVRLVGEFPNVVYVLAFDRDPVVNALSVDGLNGSDYLEKIIQVEHRLPDPAPDRLSMMLEREVTLALGDRAGRVNPGRWPEVFRKIVEPAARTPRHVRRYANSLPLALDLAGEEVDAVDVLALTALQVFLPDFHKRLPELRHDLTPDFGKLLRWRNEPAREESRMRLEALLNGLDESARGIARSSFDLLFPQTEQVFSQFGSGGETENEWRAERRVANREAFDTYLTGALPTGSLAIAEIRHIVDSLADPGELRRVLGAHEADAIDGLLRQVYPHLGDLSAGTVESALPVLAEQQSRLEPLEGALRSPAAALQTFMSALVSHVPAGDERDGMLVRFFNDQPSLSDRLLVWDLARGSDDYGRDVVRPATLDWMLEKLTELLLETTPAVLAAESRLRDLLQVCVHHAAPLRRDEVRAVLEDDNVFLTFLVNSLALAVPHERHVFAWKPVADALGGDWLRSRLGEVRSVPDASSPEGEVYRLAIEWAATSVTDRETGSAATPTEGAT